MTISDWPNDVGFNTTYCEPTPVELTVKGSIPPWAAGVLYRGGTGASEVDTDVNNKKFKVHHWFDGLAVMHRFQIIAPTDEHDTVKVLYNSRSTCDGLIQRIRKTGRINGMSFGAKYEPCTSYFKKVMSIFFRSDQSSQSLLQPADKAVSVTVSTNFPGLSSTGRKRLHGHASGIHTLCSKTDANRLQMLDPDTLEPIGLTDQSVLHPALKGPLSSAHAKSDPATGDVFNYNLDVGMRATYRIFRVSAATGETAILATFHADAAYIHSFFLTPRYVVLCVWNAFYAANGLALVWNQNIVDSIEFDASRPARWYVVDRTPPSEGGKGLVATYESEPFFAFHTVNAFETTPTPDDEASSVDIVADLVTYRDLSVLKHFYLPNLLSSSAEDNPLRKPQLKRFRLPSIPTSSSSSSTVSKAESESTAQVIDTPELPTINPYYATKPYRYVYGVLDTGRSTFYDGLVKYDFLTGGKSACWTRHGQSAGEPIFVPRRAHRDEDGDGDDEDDGVLLSVVLDGFAGRSYLLCLDAKTMVETGRAEMGGVVGFGFHGVHVREGGGGGRGVDF